MNGTYTAVVDRIVDEETAVILVEDGGDTVEQFDVPVGRLPEDAHEGGVLTVDIADGRITGINYDADRTHTRREDTAERLSRLSTRLSDRQDSDESDI